MASEFSDFVPLDKHIDVLGQFIDSIREHEATKAALEQWKARAEAAEARAAVPSAGTCDGRFDALRRLLAKELHPDFCTGGNLEKAVRQEIFKVIWPKVEELAEQAPS
jgi:hypothetical protein